MARQIVTRRDLKLLGGPNKDQTLALVGWLALCNAFGRVTTDDVAFSRDGLPTYATRWVGAIMACAGRGHREMTGDRQDVVGNRKRIVKARKSAIGLTT